MKIIVIGYSDYKEKDIIVNAISEDGPISFKVRGALNPNSAFVWLKTPLVTADVNWVENVRYRHQILKEAKLLSSPLVNDASFDTMVDIDFVMEIINKMFPDTEKHLLFHEIEKFLKADRSAELSRPFYQLIFLAKAIQAVGSGLEVDHCVFCDNKDDIVAFSFNEGGFICRSCLQPEMSIDLNPAQMKLVRYVFKTDSYFFDKDKFDGLKKENIKTVFINFNEYIKDGIGVYIEAIDKIINRL